MAYGYGKVKSKPYKLGSRGGVAWSGASKLRYDAPYKGGRRQKAKDWLSKATDKVASFASLIGFIGTLGLCSKVIYDEEKAKWGANYSILNDFLIGGFSRKMKAYMADPMGQVSWELTKGHWAFPFWLSLGTYAASKLGLLGIIIPNKANTVIRKLAAGGLVASTIGIGFMQGSGPADTIGTKPSTSTGPQNALSYYG
jgi:hypothetical protein